MHLRVVNFPKVSCEQSLIGANPYGSSKVNVYLGSFECLLVFLLSRSKREARITSVLQSHSKVVTSGY